MPFFVATNLTTECIYWRSALDLLAFRLKNYAELEPISGKPFSSKALRECYRQRAERFGWERRTFVPRSRQHCLSLKKLFMSLPR